MADSLLGLCNRSMLKSQHGLQHQELDSVNITRGGFLGFWIVFLGTTSWLGAGVRKEIAELYTQSYENKAMFLKIPVRGSQQTVFVTEGGIILDRSDVSLVLAFRVGDQVRITDVSFGRDSAYFKIASIDLRRGSKIAFQFPALLSHNFPQQSAFDAALGSSFTEGLTYSEIDSVKEDFVKGQFDQLIGQLANVTSTSNEFVIEAISEKNPLHLAAKKEAAEARKRLRKTEQELNYEVESRKETESELRQLRTESNQVKSTLSSLNQEQDRLVAQRNFLQRELREFKEKNQEYEEQVNKLVESLDLQATSAENLGKQLQALSSSINSLKVERTSLSEGLKEVSKQLENQRKINQKVSTDLKVARAKNARLRSDLRALTSNKDSLSARYLKTREERDNLQTAKKLVKALHLEKRLEKREEGTFQVADLYLQTQRIGAIEVQVPDYPGTVCSVRFSVVSPDSVRFTEQERKLYKTLGQTWKVNTAWQSSAESLKPVLLSKEPVQTVGPRESVEWIWELRGEDLSQPEQVALLIHFLNEDQQEILLPNQEFWVYPDNIQARLQQSFSPLSLLAGVLVGFAVLGVALELRRRSNKRDSRRGRGTTHAGLKQREQSTIEDAKEGSKGYVIQKKL